MILPRVVKDYNRNQILFQLFHYKSDKPEPSAEDEMVEANAEEEGEEEEEDEMVLLQRKKEEEERKRIIQELPIDLSTADIDLEKTQIYIQPCSSVYRQNFGQDDSHYVQDFQVLVYER